MLLLMLEVIPFTCLLKISSLFLLACFPVLSSHKNAFFGSHFDLSFLYNQKFPNWLFDYVYSAST